MLSFQNKKVVAVGEAMIEMASVGERLYRRGYAGDTFNTAWHMSQALGTDTTVGFVSRVGQDNLSDSFVLEAANDGLDVSGIGRDTFKTMGLYLISLEGVERSFAYWRKDSAAVALADDEATLATSLAGAGLIHLSGITLAILDPEARIRLFDALATVRRKGALVSFDPNIRSRLWSSVEEIRDTVSRALKVTDIALPSFDDETAHWGDQSPEATIERISRAGVNEIVVKNGEGPATLLSDDQISSHETPIITDICDTTGAGDAFNAGYLAARLSGNVPVYAVGYGQQMSGEVIRHYGARMPKSAIKAVSRGFDGMDVPG